MLLLTIGVLLQTQLTTPRPQVMNASAVSSIAAVPAISAPVIDGHGEDPAWAAARVIDAFRETRPVEDGDPRLKTEARIAYDERNLFVLVRAFDTAPDSIVGRLARRDEDPASDWINVYIDS